MASDFGFDRYHHTYLGTGRNPYTSRRGVYNLDTVQPEVRPFSQEMMANLQVPEGFEVTVFAEGLMNPRMMAMGDDGTIYVTQRLNSDVVALRDANGDGTSDATVVVASNIPLIHGITSLTPAKSTTLSLHSPTTGTYMLIPFANVRPLNSNYLLDGAEH